MKFDAKTLEVLKNFSSINPALKFTKGTELVTVSPLKTILAKATITSEVDEDFCIGELSRFMSALSLFDDPEISLGENSLVILDDKNRLEYVYTSEELIKVPTTREIKLPSVDAQFTLTNESFQAVKKAMSVLSLAELAVVGSDGVLSLEAIDSRGTTKDSFSINVGSTDKTFKAVFKAEYLKLLPVDYEVSICKKGISSFKNPDIEYWIAIEAGASKFE